MGQVGGAMWMALASGTGQREGQKDRKKVTGGLTGRSSLADRKACAGVPNKRDSKRQ